MTSRTINLNSQLPKERTEFPDSLALAAFLISKLPLVKSDGKI